MAEEGATVTEQVTEAISDVVNDIVNETFAKTNASSRTPTTPTEQGVAYTALLLMAVIPIYIGAWRSTRGSKGSKSDDNDEKSSSDKPNYYSRGGSEVITSYDAMTFPFVASATLFGIFLFFKVIPQLYIDYTIALYFFGLGAAAMLQVYGETLGSWCAPLITNKHYSLSLTQKPDEVKSKDSDKKSEEEEDKPKEDEVLLSHDFDRAKIAAFGICVVIALWYALTKHWLANNLIGIAFAINALELLQLSSVMTGVILLGGLFFYDVFWVFGTNVMVTVAKNFNAPIKVVFPQDLLENGIFSDRCAMLGLGDIVLPGIFIAFLLRFDLSLGAHRRTYFNSGFVSYIIGLVITMTVMVVFQHAQPALLYLVPCCVGIPLTVAFIKGELQQMIDFREEAEEEKKEEEAGAEGEKQQLKKEE